MIYFTRYANTKLDLLNKHNFLITKEMILRVLEHPESVYQSKFSSYYISEGNLDATHILKVVFKKEDGVIKVITFYPTKL